MCGAQWINMWGAACYFLYNFLKFTNKTFFDVMECTSYVPQMLL